MRITLETEVFIPPVDHTLVISLFQYALEGRHRVEAALNDEPVLDWLNLQSSNVQEEIRFAIDWSLEAEALEPSAANFSVGSYEENDWTARPIRVRLDEARRLLDAPFSILLEDARSDKEFVFKMLSPEERRFVQKQVARGFLRIDHGGGLSNMRRQVLDRRQMPETAHRTWLLFDSDALRPGTPSGDSELVRQACADIPHHQLKRRFIESYLPAGALSTWAATGGKKRSQRFRIVQAFLGLRPEQRHHFNMKRGFAQDSGRTDASAGDLYNDVDPKQRTALDCGFGEDIAELFRGEYVSEKDLRADSGWSELRPSIAKLLELLR